MTAEHAIHSVRALIEAALPAIEEMPTQTRADAYDGIYFAAKDCAPDLALIAQAAATAIREAEHRQLQFLHLLRAAESTSAH